MKPSKIPAILNLARRATKQGKVFNPLFVGPPGIGKSEIVQAWCEDQGIPFIDLRAAYLEAPDLIGFPSITLKDGRQVTTHNTPEFWPTAGEGVLLLEEPNRGTQAVLNTFMQLLTDRKIHTYNFPKSWMIVGCINPETVDYDVNTMDPALKNRFEIFDVEYDKEDFVRFMDNEDWDEMVRMFVESNTWEYKLPEKVANSPGTKYISPRTISKLNTARKSQIDTEDEELVYTSILGNNFGVAFLKFSRGDYPVLYRDLVNNTVSSLAKLKVFANPNDYKNGHISVTIRDIIKSGLKIKDELLAEVLLVLPADQAVGLLKQLTKERNEPNLRERIFDDYPKVAKYLKDTIKKGQ